MKLKLINIYVGYMKVYTFMYPQYETYINIINICMNFTS